MSNYQATGENWVLRLDDESRIPFHAESEAYAEYLDWLAAGNKPQPYTKPPEELLAQAKAARVAEVDAIVVTTPAGNIFDGDEEAQGRMARTITALDPGETTLWVLADNKPATVTREELREALRLAGEAQTTIWVRPYK